MGFGRKLSPLDSEIVLIRAYVDSNWNSLPKSLEYTILLPWFPVTWRPFADGPSAPSYTVSILYLVTLVP